MSYAVRRLMLGACRPFCKRQSVPAQKRNSDTLAMSEASAASERHSSFETVEFDNVALRSLAIDEVKDNYVRQVSGAFFSLVQPVPVENPVMVAYSGGAAELLDMEAGDLEAPEAAEYFSGNKLFSGSQPAAHCYCGHQFGYFAGQLGDGAAMYLGEVVNRKGERWELQLKGAGPTPYSRDADGRKVLRSSIREFLCSEAMHHLGIPTTRASTCVTSDSRVVRDVYYDGHPIMERCTIVSRVAQTFIRFGSFEIFKTLDPMTGRIGPSVGHNDLLDQLLNYTISSFYPEIVTAFSNEPQKMYAEFFKEVVKRTAHLVAEWQCVGFCHGVLNTDNMSIVGLTIDYGPFGFMDYYNPDYICNGSDDGGRYSFANQPKMCAWNLVKFADALRDVLPLEVSQSVLEETYFSEFDEHFVAKMRKKLGLIRSQLPEDRELVEGFLDTMAETGSDFTNSFYGLNQLLLPGSKDYDLSYEQTKSHLLKQCCSLAELHKMHRPLMNDSQFAVFATLLNERPEMLEQLGKGADIIKKELERRKKFESIKNLTAEEKFKRDENLWTEWLSKYKERLIQEVENAEYLDDYSKERKRVMDSTNPRYILRNYMAQVAIEAAEKDDFSEVQKLLKVLENPFSDTDPVSLAATAGKQKSTESACEAKRRIVSYDDVPPEWAKLLRVTCSS